MNLLKKKSPWKVVIILAVSLILIELLYIAAIFNSGTVIVMKHYSDQYYGILHFHQLPRLIIGIMQYLINMHTEFHFGRRGYLIRIQLMYGVKEQAPYILQISWMSLKSGDMKMDIYMKIRKKAGYFCRTNLITNYH